MSSLERELFGKRMPPIVTRNLGQKSVDKSSRKRLDYSPINWSKYFDSKRDIKINCDSFRVYLCGIEDPSDDNALNLPLLVLLHGGGYCSLTWSLFVKEIKELCECRIIAIDMRGHGNTFTTNDEDLSAQTLTNDVYNVINSLYDNENIPPLVLIGHSMGGAIAVHCSATLHELIPRIIGLVVIDVVEGTALEALHSMQSFLRSRPKQFPTLENAIEWCIRSGQTRNVESARVSMPGQLKNIKTNLTATSELESKSQSEELIDEQTESHKFIIKNKYGFESLNEVEMEDKIDEEVNESGDSSQKFKSLANREPISGYTWRIDLSKSEPYWSKWFEDLSNMFLNCQTDAKLLLLAGIDRLDRALTVGQMQGKFQMQVLPKCGHNVQEDVPDRVAQVIASFLIRNKFTQSKCDFERPFPSC